MLFKHIIGNYVDLVTDEDPKVARDAQFCLGMFNIKGFGVAPDRIKGLQFLESSAEKGSLLCAACNWKNFNCLKNPHTLKETLKELLTALLLWLNNQPNTPDEDFKHICQII